MLVLRNSCTDLYLFHRLFMITRNHRGREGAQKEAQSFINQYELYCLGIAGTQYRDPFFKQLGLSLGLHTINVHSSSLKFQWGKMNMSRKDLKALQLCEHTRESLVDISFKRILSGGWWVVVRLKLGCLTVKLLFR